MGEDWMEGKETTDAVAAGTAVIVLLLMVGLLCIICELVQCCLDRFFRETQEPTQVVVYHNGVPIHLTLVPDPYENHYRILEAYEANLVFGRWSHRPGFGSNVEKQQLTKSVVQHYDGISPLASAPPAYLQ